MVLGKGSQQKRALRSLLRRGSEKEVPRRCLERPLKEYDPLRRAPYPKFLH